MRKKVLARSRRYKEEPNRNFRTEKYNNQNKVPAWAQKRIDKREL